MEILGFLGRQHDGAGAKSVTEGVELGNCFSLGSFGAGRLLCVEAIGLDLFDGSHMFFPGNPTHWGASAAEFQVISPAAIDGGSFIRENAQILSLLPTVSLYSRKRCFRKSITATSRVKSEAGVFEIRAASVGFNQQSSAHDSRFSPATTMSSNTPRVAAKIAARIFPIETHVPFVSLKFSEILPVKRNPSSGF